MNNNDIVLSVVVLSYNNAPYILDCLESIANQGITSYEVFVVDDSSTDNSCELIKQFIVNHPQFELICKKNSGGAISSQVGISRCKGKYCAIVDSDDIVADGAYKTLINRIEVDNSDFAAGRPAKLLNGFELYGLSQMEDNLFAEDRVLETPDELAEFSRQVFYWNIVYKTDFIRSNNVYMPSNLLIADRIFLYKAIMCASRISVCKDLVYYWRKKANDENKSITDQTASLHMIVDRCSSFLSQVRVSLEGKLEYNKIIWERSMERLFYPYNQIDYDSISMHDFEQICEIYRITFMEYLAFFANLVETTELKATTKIIVILILEKKYEELFAFLKSTSIVTYLQENKPPKCIRRPLCLLTGGIFITNIENIKGKIYLRYCIGDYLKNLKLDTVVAYGRFFNHRCKNLDINREKKLIDIDSLNIGTYLLSSKCFEDDNSVIKKSSRNFAVRRKLGNREVLRSNQKIYIYSPATSSIKIIKKNMFMLMKDKSKIYLHVNFKNLIKRIYFYNIKNNTSVDLKNNIDNSTYFLDEGLLLPRKNVVMYETVDGLHDTIDILSLSNTKYQLRMFSNLFQSNIMVIDIVE